MDKTILFVDDEENILKALKRLFLAEDYEVLTANSGKEALELIAGGAQPEVIISDQRMPQMSGVEFLAQAREKLPDSIRIILTGYADINAAMGSINEGGVYRYIVKPWDDEDLKFTVQEAFERGELKRQNQELLALTKSQNKKLFEYSKKLKHKVEEQTREIVAKNKELETNFFNTIRAFSSLLDSHTLAMKGHGQRVSRFACDLARRLHLSEEEITDIEVGGLLHDIGKLTLPPSLLEHDKKTWSSNRKKAYQRHAEAGQHVVSFISQLDKVGEIIKHHHERYDGTGYPDHLTEEEIPFGARVVAVADAFDNVMHQEVNETSFRKEFAKETGKMYEHLNEEELKEQMAIFHLKQHAFTRFDPDVVKEALKYLKERGVKESLQMELSLNELKPGMELAAHIFTKSGISLLPFQTVLTNDYIKKLKAINENDPINGLISVVKS